MTTPKPLQELIDKTVPATWDTVKVAWKAVALTLKDIETNRKNTVEAPQAIITKTNARARDTRRALIDLWERQLGAFVLSDEAAPHLKYTYDVEIVDIEKVPEDLLVITKGIEANKALAQLQAGTEIPGLKLVKKPYIWEDFKR